MYQTEPNSQLLKKNRLLFIHLPKTGGSTMYDIINNYIFSEKKASLFIGTQEHVKQFHELNFEQVSAYKIIAGHMNFIRTKRKLGESIRQFFTFTILRNPVALSISWYQYILQTPQHFHHNKVKKMSFEEFIYSDYYVPNMQCQLISNQPLCQTTLEILKNDFDCFGTLENFDVILEKVCHHFGKAVPSYPILNKSKKIVDQEAINYSLFEKILSRNEQDVKLYTIVKAREEESKSKSTDSTCSQTKAALEPVFKTDLECYRARLLQFKQDLERYKTGFRAL
ncbi:sulfotransferase family 2 domain-containing protein [Microcoleus sp. AT9b-C3]|uniref:sulfotransferase family 2 domain-containing protein n=1 Tax=unclassified Microcoleus TaxID=2642155 RepID=UPI002FD2D23D